MRGSGSRSGFIGHLLGSEPVDALEDRLLSSEACDLGAKRVGPGRLVERATRLDALANAGEVEPEGPVTRVLCDRVSEGRAGRREVALRELRLAELAERLRRPGS